MSYRIGMTNTEDMAALPEKSGSGPVLKSDTLGRVRTPVGRRRELLAEFERSGLTTLGLSDLSSKTWTGKAEFLVNV